MFVLSSDWSVGPQVMNENVYLYKILRLPDLLILDTPSLFSS